MELEPIRLVDSIVKGTILAAYDFIRLTLSGLAFTLIRRSTRFWPGVVSLTKRLSPLTYLFLWIFIAASLYIQPNELTSIVLKGISADTYLVIILICAFVLTVGVDLLVRLGCWFITNKTRRILYESLFRITTGTVYLGAVAILFLPRIGLPGFQLFKLIGAANLELGVFALPLAVVMTKAVRAKRLVAKAMTVAAVYLAVPYLVILSGESIFFPTYFRVTDLFKPPQEVGPRVSGYSVRCTTIGNKVSLTGYIRLEGLDVLVLSPHDFHIWYVSQAPSLDLGRPDERAANIALTLGTLVKLTLEATPALKPGENLPTGQFDCSLKLHMLTPEPYSPWRVQEIPFLDRVEND